ncbi:MAG: hypothetical protein GX062_05775 [Firmicutes bacterium]|jgi:hypothetical protein|nr:hypothetical protein [Bacillota bacterium]
MPYDHGNWGPSGGGTWGPSGGGTWGPPGCPWGGSGNWGGWQQPPGCPGIPNNDPRQIVQQIDPVAQHGLTELQAGVDPLHTMRETALGGYLVASGCSASQAIQLIEQWEQMGLFR